MITCPTYPYQTEIYQPFKNLENVIENLKLLEDHLLANNGHVWTLDHIFAVSGYAKEGFSINNSEFYNYVLNELSFWIHRIKESYLRGVNRFLIAENISTTRKNMIRIFYPINQWI